MDKAHRRGQVLHMANKIRARSWRTVKSLHQVQLLSCDLCDLTEWEAKDHCAPFWRLYLHDKAGGEVIVEGRVQAVRPGRVLLIPPNTHYASRLRRPLRHLFIHFLVEPRLRSKPGAVFELDPQPELRELGRALCRQLTADATNLRGSLLAQALVSLALAELDPVSWERRYEDRRITEAVRSMEAAYPRRVPLGQLARAAGLHPGSFSRLFRACTGASPLEFLQQLRLEEACSMLHQDEASLEEIAERTGFADRGYFSRIFTKHMQCSPGRYRRLVNVSNRLRPGDA